MFKMLALACSHKAVKCSQAKCSADLATWVCPVVECQTQLGIPIDLCCFSFYEFAFPLHHSVNPVLGVVLELRSQMEDPKCLSNKKYPTKDIMAPPCTAKSCTLSTKPQVYSMSLKIWITPPSLLNKITGHCKIHENQAQISNFKTVHE
jgi:hypothetical protein